MRMAWRSRVCIVMSWLATADLKRGEWCLDGKRRRRMTPISQASSVGTASTPFASLHANSGMSFHGAKRASALGSCSQPCRGRDFYRRTPQNQDRARRILRGVTTRDWTITVTGALLLRDLPLDSHRFRSVTNTHEARDVALRATLQ